MNQQNTKTSARGVVVVGGDGSASSVHALRYAVEGALRRDVGVEVVTSWLMTSTGADVHGTASLQDFAGAAELAQDRAVREVVDGLPRTPPIAQRVRARSRRRRAGGSRP